MKQELCGGFAYSDTVTLQLRQKDQEIAEEFFSYERNSSDPNIVWSSANVLAVSVADVGRIYRKLDQIDGVQVQYRIGHQVD